MKKILFFVHRSCTKQRDLTKCWEQSSWKSQIIWRGSSCALPGLLPSSPPSQPNPSKGITQFDHCSLLLSLLSCQHEVRGRLGSRGRLLQVPAAHALYPLPAEGHPPSSLPAAQLCLSYAPSPLCQPGGHSLAPRSLSTAAAGWGRGLLHGIRRQCFSALHWGMDLRPIPVHFHNGHRGRFVLFSCLSSLTLVGRWLFIPISAHCVYIKLWECMYLCMSMNIHVCRHMIQWSIYKM